MSVSRAASCRLGTGRPVPAAPCRALPLATPALVPRHAAQPFSSGLSRKRQLCQQTLYPVVTAAAAAAAAPAAPAGASGDGSGNSSGGLWAAFSRLANTLTNLFPVFVLGAAVWALAQPSAFDWFEKGAITPTLAVTMLGMGLTLTFEDFKRVLTTPGRIFAGFVLQYTIMPFLAYAVSRLAGLPLAFTIGLCIVGSCPGGTASNVVTYLAKADVTLSVAMTTASTLGAVIATPLLTQLLLGTLVPVDATALLKSTLQVVLLPVVVGAAINTAFPKQVALLAPVSALSAVVLIALICGSVMAQNAAAVLAAGPQLLAAVAALHAGGFLLGYGLSRVVGMPETVARTNSIEVGMQNSALGALLASLHFPAHPLAAVPCAISACTHSIMGSLLAAYWRTQPTELDQPPAAAATSTTASTVSGSGSGSIGFAGSGAGASGSVSFSAPSAAAAVGAPQQAKSAAAASSSSGGTPAASSGGAEGRSAAAAEARAWIDAWRSKQGRSAAAAEARAWIDAWRSRQGRHAEVAVSAAEVAAGPGGGRDVVGEIKARLVAWKGWQQLSQEEMEGLLSKDF